jgi:hypothetical protein
MELFPSEIDKLEADFATMMSTHANPPGMGQGPKCGEPQHWVPGYSDPTDKVQWVEPAKRTSA